MIAPPRTDVQLLRVRLNYEQYIGGTELIQAVGSDCCAISGAAVNLSQTVTSHCAE